MRHKVTQLGIRPTAMSAQVSVAKPCKQEFSCCCVHSDGSFPPTLVSAWHLLPASGIPQAVVCRHSAETAWVHTSSSDIFDAPEHADRGITERHAVIISLATSRLEVAVGMAGDPYLAAAYAEGTPGGHRERLQDRLIPCLHHRFGILGSCGGPLSFVGPGGGVGALSLVSMGGALAICLRRPATRGSPVSPGGSSRIASSSARLHASWSAAAHSPTARSRSAAAARWSAVRSSGGPGSRMSRLSGPISGAFLWAIARHVAPLPPMTPAV